MPLPTFYNQGDQDIYESGDQYIPQEQYRLGYTASPSIANAASTSGITNTQAAGPYIWPPQGGGNGGGGGGNKFGLNLDTLKTVTGGQWSVDNNPFGYGSYKKTDRDIAQTQGGIWKDVKTGQNVYHANIPYKGVLGTLVDKAIGRKTKPGFPDEGSWTGADWDEDFDPRFAGTRLNTIQRWKEKRNIVKAQEKAAADKVAADAAANQVQQNIQAYGSRDRPNTGMNEPGGGKGQSPTGGDVSGTPFAQGGRIGMAKGKIPKIKSKGPAKFFSPGSGLSWEDKLYMLSGGLSPLGIGRKVDASKLGRAGRLGLGSLRFMGLTNPWFAIPAALTGAAKYSVGKAFDPYRDETGKIGAEGHAQLASAARAREELMFARNAARQNRRAGGLAGLL